jgi:hypothetical protein
MNALEKRLRKILDLSPDFQSNFVNQLVKNANEGSLIIIDTKNRQVSSLPLDKNKTIIKR